MTYINLKIKVPSDAKSEALRGIMASILSGNIDILTKRRKGSYLNHFYFERLNRREKRWILQTFSQIIDKLLPEPKNTISESEDPAEGGTAIQDQYKLFFKTLQDL
jgi:hypothetical protein